MANKVITQLSGNVKRPAGSQWLSSFFRESSRVTFSPAPPTSILLVHLVPDASLNVGQDLSFILRHHWESLNCLSLLSAVSCIKVSHRYTNLRCLAGLHQWTSSDLVNWVNFLTLQAWWIVPKRQMTLWLLAIRFQHPWLIGSTYRKHNPCHS